MVKGCPVELSPTYNIDEAALVRTQLAEAGYRLARLLNALTAAVLATGRILQVAHVIQVLQPGSPRKTAMRTLVVACSLVVLASGMTFSVSVSLAMEPAERLLPPLYRESATEGTVARYLLDPRGEIEGLLLTDGTQMHVTSHIASELIKVMKPGDRIRARGTRKRQAALFEPRVIQNLSTGTSFSTPLRLDLPIPDQENRLSMTDMKASGTLEVLLYDYMNETVRGMLLSDGTQVRFPPDATDALRRSLRVGQSLKADGYGTENEYGRAMEALRLGFEYGRLIPLDATGNSLDASDQAASPGPK